MDDEALETQSNNNYGKSRAKVAPIWYAKDIISAARNKQGKQLNAWTSISGYDDVLREKGSGMHESRRKKSEPYKVRGLTAPQRCKERINGLECYLRPR